MTQLRAVLLYDACVLCVWHAGREHLFCRSACALGGFFALIFSSRRNPRNRSPKTDAMLPLLAAAAAFVAPHSHAFLGPHASTVPASRAGRAVASAKIIPAVNLGLGGALLSRVAGAGSKVDAAVLASTGLLATLNLAVTDNARYASAKRALAVYEGKVSLPGQAVQQLAVAKKWMNLVRLQLVGQLAGLVWMARAGSPTGVLRGAVVFMAANVAFFLLGAATAKHDEVSRRAAKRPWPRWGAPGPSGALASNAATAVRTPTPHTLPARVLTTEAAAPPPHSQRGLPAPMRPQLQKFVLSTDIVLCASALVASALAPGSAGRAATSGVFVAGCMIGAVEGVPKTVAALQALLSRPAAAA